jgi:hypothetical protein
MVQKGAARPVCLPIVHLASLPVAQAAPDRGTARQAAQKKIFLSLLPLSYLSQEEKIEESSQFLCRVLGDG